jgi:uncharacterized protein (DUF1697 family)
MTRYVAFLRAINVGGHTVKMQLLQRLFEEMGFANVATFIASGNVVFESAVDNTRELEQTIEQGLQQALGYEVITFLRTIPEVATVAEHTPFPAAEFEAGAVLYIAFVREPLSDELQEKLMFLQNELDAFDVNGREIYWLHRKQLRKPGKTADVPLEKTLKIPATIRNVNTIRRMAAKYR